MSDNLNFVTRRGRGGGRARPNRGGGRHSKRPSSGSSRVGGSDRRTNTRPSAGLGGRKGGAKYVEDGDDFTLVAQEIPAVERDLTYDRPRRQVSKVVMQKLFMSEENQELVRDMLNELHMEDESEEYSEEEYDELDHRDVSQYWTTDSKLMVEQAQAFSPFDSRSTTSEPKSLEVATEKALNVFALKKLMRYGFEKQRCVLSLSETNGDIGVALEKLLSLCFDLPANNTDQLDVDNPGIDYAESDLSWDEILEQRNEEMTALSSIYEDKFKELIPNSVWTIKLTLPYVTDYVRQLRRGDSEARKRQTESKQNALLCRFFLKGNCKFGHRCRNLHGVPEDPEKTEFTYGTDNITYNIEIRFPKGNKYPADVPVIAFFTTNEIFPNENCLCITARLYEEAKVLVNDKMPVVFSLVSILENEEEMLMLLKMPPHEFSRPAPIISRKESYKTLINSVDVTLNQQAADKSKATVENILQDDMLKDKLLLKSNIQKKFSKEMKNRYAQKLSPQERIQENKKIIDRFQKVKCSQKFVKMIAEREKLPAWREREKIVKRIHDNQVVVVSGMTGCGKTTQVPQFILDSFINKKDPDNLCSIVCTQPRRISAMAVAERVADERAEKLGGTVGYQIRLESVMSASTRLMFCTTGILLRRLEGDSRLHGVSHVVIDEVHERSEESDFLMMVLRDLLPKRKDLKLILMSATLNADLFSSYFNGCPVFDIPGKTFPVEQFFLEDTIEFTNFFMEETSAYARPLKRANSMRIEDIEDDLKSITQSSLNSVKDPKDNVQDQNLTVKELFKRFSEYKKSTIKTMAIMDHEKINYELIESVLEWIVDGQHEYPRNGAILIFLPGMAEIMQMYEQLTAGSLFGSRANKDRFKIIPLHSTLSSEEQHAVFNRPKKGVTKIVIATNIAETSITIDDVVFVVDAGKMKEKRYDPAKSMESLDTVWVSRANAIQRKGRAGRVTSGICFHLFTKHRFHHHIKGQPVPEIQRASLEQLVLNIKILELFRNQSIETVMSKLIEPPMSDNISSALKRLQDLGALHIDNELTALGYHLASLPVDVRIGKLMLFGAIFRCLDPALTIAATLSYKSPFVAPFDKREEADAKKLEFATGNSDHLTALKAYKSWIKAAKNGSHAGYIFCQENYLSIKTLQMLSSMKRQFVELLSDIGFVQQGLSGRQVERLAKHGSDGIIEATGADANNNANNEKLIAAILVAALYPNIVQIMTPQTMYSQSSAGAVPKAPKPEDIKFKTKSDGYIHIHPSSVNFQVRYYESPYLVYHEKVKTSKVFVRDCTMVSVYPLILFSGESVSIDLHRGDFIISVDDSWMKFLVASHQIAELIRELRSELDQLLEDKIANPSMNLLTCPRGSKIIDTIVHLIKTQ